MNENISLIEKLMAKMNETAKKMELNFSSEDLQNHQHILYLWYDNQIEKAISQKMINIVINKIFNMIIEG